MTICMGLFPYHCDVKIFELCILSILECLLLTTYDQFKRAAAFYWQPAIIPFFLVVPNSNRLRTIGTIYFSLLLPLEIALNNWVLSPRLSSLYINYLFHQLSIFFYETTRKSGINNNYTYKYVLWKKGRLHYIFDYYIINYWALSGECILTE